MSFIKNISIKGKNIWKICALLVLAIVITCCITHIKSVDQPTTGVAGQTLTITLQDSVYINVNGGGSISANYVFAMLVPKGWAGAQNMTVSYVTTLGGTGTMVLMPSTTLEPQTVSAGTNLTWTNALKAKFGIEANLVDDLEWVVFESPKQITFPNTQIDLGTVTIKLKAGVDMNTTIYKPSYVICESQDGLDEDAAWSYQRIYDIYNGPKLTVTGPNDVIDLCDPQLTSANPPKALDNEFVTISYNSTLDSLHLLQGNQFYLCVDSASTTDGKDVAGICTQTAASKLTETSATSNVYNITIWPRTYLGLTSTQQLSKLYYHIIDASGNRVGFNDTSSPFTFKFSCN